MPPQPTFEAAQTSDHVGVDALFNKPEARELDRGRVTD
jgi:hypothetical protein